MNAALHEDQLRVTSIPYTSSQMVIFSGTPLKKNSYRTNNGKYYVTIKVDPDTLPAQPVIGQYWSVKGSRQVESMDIGDYVMQQHTYQSPEYVECSLPETGEQLIRFIAREAAFKGIGESKARALWELLGKNFHANLRKDTPESRAKLRTVLSEDSIIALFEGYAKYKNLAYCNWMSEHKIPASVQQRLLKYHNEQSIEVIKQNPYVLIGFGVSFENIDQLIMTNSPQLKFEIENCDHRRLSAALEIAIRKEIEKGHTYTIQADLRPYLTKLLKDKKLVAKAFKAGYDKAQYLLNHTTGTYHPTAQLLMENVVAKRLKALASENNLYDEYANSAYCSAAGELPYDLTKKQIEAVTTCLDNAVSCITGGAGTGKTTVLRTALRAYHVMGFEIHAVALSGRAAMRLHESIGFITSTIAKFLRAEPIDTDKQKHLLVIDEASMIDLPIMYRLVNHIHPSVRIIFTGDPDQLPPIGCGKVLADIVASKAIANTMLDIVKRQEGSTGIPEYSKLINQGKVPEQLTTGAIHFHETDKKDISQICCELYQQSPENSRVMAPTKALVAEINKLTQEVVNHSGSRLEFEMNGEKFFQNLRLNDTILFTQNHYDKGIQNGSLGTLTSVDASGEGYGEVTLDTGDKIEVTQAVLDCMELGYAITLHKAQGSQFPRIIIALQKGRIVDRAWLYTAITRAESEIHIVGSEGDFRAITEAPSHSHRRNSYLVELLKR